MKKQIFILMFLSLAFVFAGVNNAFGQVAATPGSAPRPLTDCETGPMRPIAGVPYDYEANFSPANGTSYWFATFDNVTFMSGGELTTNQEVTGGDFISAASDYRTSITETASPSGTNITWKSLGLSQVTDENPLFVVVHYESPVCADNLKVIRIEPLNAFLINVLNLGETDYGTDVESCYSDMVSAVYDLTNECVTYNYGINDLDFEIVASNFTDSYTPTFRVNGIQTGQTVEVLISSTSDFATTTSLGTLDADGTVAGGTVTTTATNTSNGVSVYVRLVVNNNGYEGLTNDDISLAAAGVNAANEPNVRWDACEVPVDLTAALTATNGPDYALHTLTQRPTVTPVAPVEFEENCGN